MLHSRSVDHGSYEVRPGCRIAGPCHILMDIGLHMTAIFLKELNTNYGTRFDSIQERRAHDKGPGHRVAGTVGASILNTTLPHVPNTAIVSHSSNILRKDVGIRLGLCTGSNPLSPAGVTVPFPPRPGPCAGHSGGRRRDGGHVFGFAGSPFGGPF